MSSDEHTSEHELELGRDDVPYKCGGCKELGFGSRYRCKQCDNYALHECCAHPAETILHPFFKKRVFHFQKGAIDPTDRFCDGCGRSVEGFHYLSENRKHDLHPACAILQHKIKDGGVELSLRSETRFRCRKCGERENRTFLPSWSYEFTGSYCYHVACLETKYKEEWQKTLIPKSKSGGSSERNK